MRMDGTHSLAVALVLGCMGCKSGESARFAAACSRVEQPLKRAVEALPGLQAKAGSDLWAAECYREVGMPLSIVYGTMNGFNDDRGAATLVSNARALCLDGAPTSMRDYEAEIAKNAQFIAEDVKKMRSVCAKAAK